MVRNISDQFSDILKLKFFNLLAQKKFTRFKTEFPGNAMSCLAQNYSVHFNFTCLRSELTNVSFTNTPRCKNYIMYSLKQLQKMYFDNISN